jgi:hypothetical protein
MSRRHRADKREILPDPKFANVVVTKFMNSIMYEGKKSVAESIVYGAFDIVQTKLKQDPVSVRRFFKNGGFRSRTASRQSRRVSSTGPGTHSILPAPSLPNREKILDGR